MRPISILTHEAFPFVVGILTLTLLAVVNPYYTLSLLSPYFLFLTLPITSFAGAARILARLRPAHSEKEIFPVRLISWSVRRVFAIVTAASLTLLGTFFVLVTPAAALLMAGC